MRQLGRSARTRLLIGASAAAILCSSGAAYAQERPPITIAPQPLAAALYEFGGKTGTQVIFASSLASAKQSGGVAGESDERLALAQLLEGTGLTFRRDGDIFVIIDAEGGSDPQSGSAAGDGADGTVEALIVTAQKREEDIQDVPIAISAFTQETLERSQVAGGPDLMTQVPNMTFTKTNFTSYSIQIRGIGTQAISATTDAAVAVAFNNTPFIRNRFFEQEFYDLQRVEVLRGPQGTLYGRNATAGVVNLISQKPKFGYEAKISADVSNYNSTRLEGMVNVPLAEDKVALRLAAAWTKREGFVTNEITGNPIDGRDLWSTRVSLRFAPTDAIDVNLIWEHFEEDDDRLRSGKQLCNQDDRTSIQGHAVSTTPTGYMLLFNQGCLPASLYSPDSFEAPNGFALPYYYPLGIIGVPVVDGLNPYTSLVQSRDLRVIESTVDPHYKARSDLAELQVNVDLGDNLTLTSETAYNADFLFSTQDFNRFNTASGAWAVEEGAGRLLERGVISPEGVFCDPQIGCADRLVGIDLSTAKTRQFSQEFRLTSAFDGPFNFSLGANWLRYDTEDKYYVFINSLTLYAATGGFQNERLGPYQVNVSDNSECLRTGFREPDPRIPHLLRHCVYIDPNPIGSLNDMGHNYFLSRNPYKLISYAVFGEAYYNLTENLKVTAGLRWTVDKKEAPRIPSWVLASYSVGYPVADIIEQEWREPTGRAAIDWKPDLAFTDETLLYASYAHGYKAGGANPPTSGGVGWDDSFTELIISQSAVKPRTFDAEFVDAFELGAKNTLLDGKLTVNMAAFYYDYEGYQISQIIDRSAVNYNFDAKVWGLEIEADWRPLENLKLGFKGGYENTRIADGEEAIDIMDRTAGREGWVVVRPFPTMTMNCVLPIHTVSNGDGPLVPGFGPNTFVNGNMGPCEFAYLLGHDPVTNAPYVDPPVSSPGFPIYPGYTGYNPLVDVGQNNGEGFNKPLGGNELPNAPNFTATITADYTLPLPNDWLATLHTDLYYQSEAWTRVFNTEGYDKLKAYTNVNVAAIFTNEEAGWKVMAYVKNVFDRDSITGAFLFSDDVGLTTNVFLTEPRLYGLRVTKDWNGGPWWTGANPNHTGPWPLTVELGGQVQRHEAPYETIRPGWYLDADGQPFFSSALDPLATQNRDLDWGDGREFKITWRPASRWNVSAAYRVGEANTDTARLHAEEPSGPKRCGLPQGGFGFCDPTLPKYLPAQVITGTNWSDSAVRSREEHSIVDFAVGMDAGLGMLENARSALGFGLRYASFESTSAVTLDGIPDWALVEGWQKYDSTHHRLTAELTAEREFTGTGPVVTWDAALPLLGGQDMGHVSLDWSLTGGVLFGKQKTSISGTENDDFFSAPYPQYRALLVPEPATVVSEQRSDTVNVPVLDLSLGLSYEIGRVNVGAGYRWERYFDVLDAGDDAAEQVHRTIDGPYFKIAVGFGG